MNPNSYLYQYFCSVLVAKWNNKTKREKNPTKQSLNFKFCFTLEFNSFTDCGIFNAFRFVQNEFNLFDLFDFNLILIVFNFELEPLNDKDFYLVDRKKNVFNLRRKKNQRKYKSRMLVLLLKWNFNWLRWKFVVKSTQCFILVYRSERHRIDFKWKFIVVTFLYARSSADKLPIRIVGATI